MLSMLRLLAILTILNSSVFANANKEIESFLSEKFSENPRFKSVEVKVEDSVKIKELQGWSGYIVDIKAHIKKPKRDLEERMVWFSNGRYITKELTDMQTGLSVRNDIIPTMKKSYYKDENLICGDKNAKHRVAIFSDPMCPFCKSYVPKAIKDMKKSPKKFAVYYYHLPLSRIHPASMSVVKCAIAAELAGAKDVELKAYNLPIEVSLGDEKLILKKFNKAMGTKLTLKDINSKKVLQRIKDDADISEKLLVKGTPTVYFDGKIDVIKNKYKKVK